MRMHNILVLLSLIGDCCSYNQSYVEKYCYQCINRQKTFFKVLWDHKTVLYQCFTLPSFLSSFAIVLDAACESEHCVNIYTRLPDHVRRKEDFNCSNIAAADYEIDHNPSPVECSSSDGLHLLVVTSVFFLVEAIIFGLGYAFYKTKLLLHRQSSILRQDQVDGDPITNRPVPVESSTISSQSQSQENIDQTVTESFGPDYVRPPCICATDPENCLLRHVHFMGLLLQQCPE